MSDEAEKCLGTPANPHSDTPLGMIRVSHLHLENEIASPASCNIGCAEPQIVAKTLMVLHDGSADDRIHRDHGVPYFFKCGSVTNVVTNYHDNHICDKSRCNRFFNMIYYGR